MFKYSFLWCVAFGAIISLNLAESFLLGWVTWTLLAFFVLLPFLILFWIMGWFVDTREAANTINNGTIRVKVEQ